MKGFTTAVAEFTDRIIKRAVEKRKEMDAEDANDPEGDDDNVPLGPGGLNPFKVTPLSTTLSYVPSVTPLSTTPSHVPSLDTR